MRPEDLFQAIGAVEESRLARSELCVSSEKKQEDKTMKARPARIIRNFVVAAIIVSMLAVTAYAVTGYLIFSSPEEMVSAIFGDQTGFDYGARGEILDKNGEVVASRPGFDRVSADETVVAEDVAPYVDMIGQSITSGGYTLTVDAFMYDDATKCGIVTYLLESSGEIPYKLQYDGEIWYDGMADPVQVNEYGYPHIIQEKTTNTCLAVVYYFRNTGMHGEDLVLSLPSEEEPRTDDEINEIMLELDARLRQELTAPEAIEKAQDLVGQAVFEQQAALPDESDMTQEEWDAERAYTILRSKWYHTEYEQKGHSISIPMDGTAMKHIKTENGAVTISPICFQLDVTGLDSRWTGSTDIPMAEVGELTICFADGTEYTVMEDGVDNTIFKLVDSASEGEDDIYNRYTCMFNRIIDVSKVTSVVMDGGVELAVDE